MGRKTQQADDALAEFNFGEGVAVVQQGAWNTSDPADLTKVVYVKYDDDTPEANSHRVSFHVRFDANGNVDDAYALEMEHGQEICRRGDVPARASA